MPRVGLSVDCNSPTERHCNKGHTLLKVWGAGWAACAQCLSPSLSSPGRQAERVRGQQGMALLQFCCAYLSGWLYSEAEVQRAAEEARGQLCCLPADWLGWKMEAQGQCLRGPGSYRKGPHLGHRGFQADRPGQGHTHSLAESGSLLPALPQSEPRCTAERRPLLGRREKGVGF